MIEFTPYSLLNVLSDATMRTAGLQLIMHPMEIILSFAHQTLETFYREKERRMPL